MNTDFCKNISTNSKYQDKIDISYTEFSLYNFCSHKYLVERHLKLYEPQDTVYILFGNAIHHALEVTFKKSLGSIKRKSEFKNHFKKNMMNKLVDSPSFDSDLSSFIKQGETLLDILDVSKILDEYRVVSIEETMYEQIIGDYHFKGMIDIFLQNRKTGKYLIIDWKTSSNPWNFSKKKRSSHFGSQLKLYKYFISKKRGISIDDIECEYVILNRDEKNGKPSIEFYRLDTGKEKILEIIKDFSLTVNNIHIKKKFDKIKQLKGSGGCFRCPLKGGGHPLCDSTVNQSNNLLKEKKNGIL